jgi:hypothetical protein
VGLIKHQALCNIMKKFNRLIWPLLVLILFTAACDTDTSKKTLGDTSSVNSAGGPPIRDTATINKDRRDSAKIPAADSTAKGNVDPTGHATPKQK